MRRLLLKVVFWILYSRVERKCLRAATSSVKIDPTIPVYTKDIYRNGAEARHDVACHRAELMLPELGDKELNLGVELAYQSK